SDFGFRTESSRSRRRLLFYRCENLLGSSQWTSNIQRWHRTPTSRNCSASAPGTTPAFHVCPPSVVTVNVPARPHAHTTCGFTGHTAIRPLVVPLFWGVSVG